MAKKEENKPLHLNIVPKRHPDSKRVFSNFVRVAKASEFELSLQFCDIKPAENDEEQEKVLKEKRVEVTIDCEIVLPTEVAQGLIEAIQSQIKKIKP